MPWGTTQIKKAIDFAFALHSSRPRAGGMPSTVHLARVAFLVGKYFEPDHRGHHPSSGVWWGYEQVIIAAWLHDIVEDFYSDRHEEGHRVILQMYGSGVAYLVRGLTNGPHDTEKTTRAERKQADRERLKTAHHDVRLMKALDRLDNVSDMEDFTDKLKQLYVDETLQLLEAIMPLENAGNLVSQLYELVGEHMPDKEIV